MKQDVRLWFLRMIGRLVIETERWETDSPSCWRAWIPNTDLRGYGHSEEMAIGNLITSYQFRLGFILKHKEQVEHGDDHRVTGNPVVDRIRRP